LVERIEHWQSSNEENPVAEGVCEGAPHLQPLANSFATLMDEQRKVERQMRVKQEYLEFAAHHDPLTHLLSLVTRWLLR